MAILGYIRTKGSALMITMVVLGVGGFLFMDIGASQMMGGSGLTSTIGKVNGEEITRDEFSELSGYYSNRAQGALREQIDNYVWAQLEEQALVEEQAKKAGLSVTSKEMGELYLGDNTSPMVMQMYGDQQTGQVDRNLIKQMIDFYSNPIDYSQIDPSQQEQVRQQRNDWLTTEKLVRYNRLSGKYQALLSKGFYVPSWMVEKEYTRNNKQLDFNFVRVSYAQIPNDKVSVTDDELNSYLKENAKLYEQEANASIKYVAFSVQATAADSAEYSKALEDVVDEFASLETNEEVFNFTERFDGRFDSISFLKKDELREGLAMSDSIFRAPVGTVVGPYIHEGYYKLAKLVSRRSLPDSVRCRQIMIGDIQSQDQARAAMQTLDSIKALLVEGKSNFDTLAMQYSTDATSRAKGGDMGYLAMGQSGYGEFFDKNIFFLTEEDSFSITASQTGYHLVQVLDKKVVNDVKGVRLATISRAITPSDATTRAARERATTFMANSRDLAAFEKAAQEQNIAAVTAANLPLFGTSIEGLEESSTTAEIIRWAHNEAELGKVASRIYNIEDTDFNYTKQIVVPVLTSRQAKGLANLDNDAVRTEVDLAVRNKKRLELFKKEAEGKQTLQDLAAAYNVQVETATGVKYGNPFVNDVEEANVAAAALRTELNKLSPAVAGEQGMYVVSPTKVEEGMPIMELALSRRQVAQRFTGALGASLLKALKDNAKISDNRKNALMY